MTASRKLKAEFFLLCAMCFCLSGFAAAAKGLEADPSQAISSGNSPEEGPINPSENDSEDEDSPPALSERAVPITISNEQIEILRAALKEASQTRLKLNPQEEYYLGRAVTAQVLARYKPYDCPALNQYINLLGQSLALFSSRPELYNGYRFLVLDSDEINAFASPGGHILVTRGLIKLTRSEDELAAVLAHEIAHVALKHGASTIEGLRLTELLSQAAINAGLASKGQVADFTAAFGDAIAALAKEIIVSGYSQAYEFQADNEARNIIAKACYDPQALAGLIGRLPEREASNSGYVKTHPERVSRLEMLSKSTAPEACAVKKESWAQLTAVRDERYNAARQYF